jgi:biotin carboxyl carrier protein
VNGKIAFITLGVCTVATKTKNAQNAGAKAVLIGDTVAEDEILFEVSTDKVDSEVPATAAGILTEIRVPEGVTVEVGTILAVLGGAGAAGDGAGR